MRFFLIWTLLSLMVAVAAKGKGRSGTQYFLLSMMLTPIVGALAVLAIPKPRPPSGEIIDVEEIVDK